MSLSFISTLQAVNIRRISSFINFFPSASIYTHFVYPDAIRCTLRKTVMLCSGYAQIFFPATFILYLCPKKNSTNHFEFYARSKHFSEPTLCLVCNTLVKIRKILLTRYISFGLPRMEKVADSYNK